ncbi:MAG: hypothetical protein CME15_10650 [Gemmatimonadetes bacterium]|nr:hypothetical protein [Gemmatimonadota bacterium]
MTGTFGGALEARDIPASEDRLSAEATGEIEKAGNVLVIRRIRVTYHLKIDPAHREAAERVHAVHADYCPVARSISGCIDITTSLVMEEVE